MKTNPTNPTELWDRIDLLVEGELAASDREALLEQLDFEAEGWKRCALGFLEAQAWREAMEEEPAVERVVPSRRNWRTPIAAAAAALTGFLAAWFAMPREAGPVAVAESPAPEVQRVVEYVPFPVDQGGGLVPASDEHGQLYYTTRDEVPGVFLDALERAGHRVEHIERVVNLPRENGEPLELPLTETRILVNHQL